jgi:hypothetical protein
MDEIIPVWLLSIPKGVPPINWAVGNKERKKFFVTANAILSIL